MTGTTVRTGAVSFTELNARRLGPVRRYFRTRPRAMDAVVILAFLVLTLPDALFMAADEGTWLALAGVVLAGSALAFRRSRPLAVLAFVAVLDLPLSFLTEGVGSSGAATAFALYSVATAYPLRRAFAASVAAAALSLAAVLLLPATAFAEAPWVSWLLAGFVVMILAAAAGIGITVRRDREHERELRDWAARNAELASASERTRIAREMHDVVAHSLTVMVALSDGAAVVMKRDPTRAEAVLGELSAAGRTALADMRRVLGLLRADVDAPAPLPASSSVTQLLDGFRAAGLPLRVTTSGPLLPEDPAFQLTIYRILQESLTNVLRYGKGVTLVDIRITRTGRAVTLRIADDGGSPMEPVASFGSGQGLEGMRERAAIYAGSVECGRRPSGGWVVDVQLTIPDGESGNQRGNEKDDHAGDHAVRPGYADQGSAR
ncbi:sensor histidine kinase [Arthrobacter echini]|nr:histidine kinase [Arthrobacter echini]